MQAHYNITLPGRWVDAAVLERTIQNLGEPHLDTVRSASVIFPAGCKVMVDAAARLLSLVNQLAYGKREVVLEFQESHDGVMGYFNRLGFFDLLHPGIVTLPSRPERSSAQVFGGSNTKIVEFIRLNPSDYQRDTPIVLANHLENACQHRSDAEKVGLSALTIFGELIDNIYEHSQTPIDGYAALQVYSKGKKACVVVSDSGVGLFQTIRPSLTDRALISMTDAELLIHMVKEGVSRYGSGQGGAGLPECAKHALKYRANLSLRLPTASFTLAPTSEYNAIATARSGLPYYSGTHFSFEFRLDEPA